MKIAWILGAILVACSYDGYASNTGREQPSAEAGPDSATGELADDAEAPDAMEQRDASIRDAASDAMTTDRGLDALSDGSAPGPVAVGFDTAASLSDFTFWTAPTAGGGPGTWMWTPMGDPHLVQASNVTPGGSGLGAGTYAIYNGVTFTDGSVSVRMWSGDVNSGAVIIRYVDATNYYRFRVDGTGISPSRVIERRSGNELTPLAWDIASYSHLPEHTLKLEAVGGTLRAYVDGARVLTANDPAPLGAGKAGLETIALADAHFDDFTVVVY